MDPDACLRELRGLMHRFADEQPLDEAEQERVVELWDALDGWMSRGGFAPVAWSDRSPQRRASTGERADEYGLSNDDIDGVE